MTGIDGLALPAVCPVCRSDDLHHLETIGIQIYWRCGTCAARILDPAQRLSEAAERVVYNLHENDIADSGYRTFLDKLAGPLLARLDGPSHGLDYGCGPAPALAAMLTAAGHRMALYDPLFRPDRAPLSMTYDFITCSETAEHFHDPAGEFARFDALLRPGGWLAVMTCFQTDDARFADWHYRRDPTHVVFYRAATLRWLAARYGWSCEIPVKDVALMRKPPS